MSSSDIDEFVRLLRNTIQNMSTSLALKRILLITFSKTFTDKNKKKKYCIIETLHKQCKDGKIRMVSEKDFTQLIPFVDALKLGNYTHTYNLFLHLFYYFFLCIILRFLFISFFFIFLFYQFQIRIMR